MTETEKTQIITDKAQLIAYFESGCTPFDQWGIGTEHEKFLYRQGDFRRLAYEGEQGIRSILQRMQQFGWQPQFEGEHLIALQLNGASISLEPGGQFELSGRNFSTIHETFSETRQHFDELSKICGELGFFSLPLGSDPLWSPDQLSWMPKQRYNIMRKYMPTRGQLGLHMMSNTATIQVNLDYSSEADMIEKMRIAQAVQPIASAIFANSPFTAGQPNGYLSYRSEIWNDTDPDRCGFLPFIFEADFSFERWVDYLLDVPLYFIYRNGEYISARGLTFRQFMAGKHELQPTLEDWETHASTVFPDVRLKRYIEMRGADASCARHIAALSAFWVGLLYDETSRQATSELIARWDLNDLRALRQQVPVRALQAQSGELHAGNIARQLYQLASDGLTRRAHYCHSADESNYLDPVKTIVENGQTQAERLLQCYREQFDSNFLHLLQYWCERQIQSCPSKLG